ncbi:hypothetical protein ACGFOU_00735 [Streptomyces sp. NPDC048595]|uniref:hypothetical protein n=1 Tax=Streptomyces sp. NPDC048595 TaxID=3365576 RepID=UPI0037158F9C
MRTRLAAGSVAAAALLTLFGTTSAGADDTTSHARPKAAAAPAGDQARSMHDDPERRHHGKRHDGREEHSELRESPVRLTACALGTALGSLTGLDNSCVHERLGLNYPPFSSEGPRTAEYRR